MWLPMRLRWWWQRAIDIRQHVQLTEEFFHLLLAVCTGIMAALVNLLYLHAIDAWQQIFTHHTGDPVNIASSMSAQMRFWVPTIGGLLAGLILFVWERIVGPMGWGNMMEAVVAGDGRIPFRPSMARAASSILSLASGASLGREGGITQITATLGSAWGQRRGWEPFRLRLLVGCGAAAGIAAAYNAPIAGAVFAATVVMGNFSMTLFAPLLLASVVSSVISRSFLGIDPWYKVQPFDFTRVTQLPWFLLLGIGCGILGAVFLKLLRWSEKTFEKAPAPIFIRVMTGGMIVGLIAQWLPEVCGNGYAITNKLLQTGTEHSVFTLKMLGLLFLAKVAATAVSVGSGAVGGVMTPTLFTGAALGSAFGGLLHSFGHAADLPVTAFALAGMAGVLAATTRSPLLAMILVFEISMNYSLMPALMVACAVSVLSAKVFHDTSVYTEPLRAKGIKVRQEAHEPGSAFAERVGDVMRKPIPPLHENTPLAHIANRFLGSSSNSIPVVNDEGRLIGAVALQDIKFWLSENERMPVIALDVMRPPPFCVTPSQLLVDVITHILDSEQRFIPVVNNPKDMRLVGALARADVLGRLSEALSSGGHSDAARI